MQCIYDQQHLAIFATIFKPGQNKKYRCASGSTVAGSQVITFPSTATSYVSGFTVMSGVLLL